MRRRYLTDEQRNSHAWYAVYQLVEPLTSHIRYVGCTNSPFSRLNQHCNHAASKAMGNWIHGLKLQGLIPELQIIEDGLTYGKAMRLEKRWIRAYRLQGHPILNVYPVEEE